MSTIKDLTGMTFGRLKVLKRLPDRILKSNKKVTLWLCLCDCGNTKEVQGSNLKSGKTKSCGCLQKEKVVQFNLKHSNAKRNGSTRLYRIWCGIKTRCTNKNHKDYKCYGGRGITLCQEWLEFLPFKQWSEENGYNNKLSIDRINNNGNYEPSNCRWIPHKEQMYNTRQNHYISFNNKTLTLHEWSLLTGIKETTILNRIRRGWSIERALTTPTRNVTNS